ncbi:MAG TPA: cyanophycin synthetase, partial [Planctomycetaceae bacterium]
VETCRARSAPLFELGRDFTYRYHLADRTDNDACPTADVETSGKLWQNLELPLVGEHQARNLALAAVAVERLQEQGWKIPDAAVGLGLASFRWPGRIEVLGRRPTVIVDAAHNWEAIAALLRTLDESFPARRRVLVFAATRDKDVLGMLRQLLPRFDTVVVTCFQNNPRHVPVEALVRMVRSLTEQPLHWAADAAAAWKLARRFASADDLICVTGSFFLAAETRELLVDGALVDGALVNRASVNRVPGGVPGNLPALLRFP